MPNPTGWRMTDETTLWELPDRASHEELLDILSPFYRCSQCGRLHVWWPGHEAPEVFVSEGLAWDPVEAARRREQDPQRAERAPIQLDKRCDICGSRDVFMTILGDEDRTQRCRQHIQDDRG